MEVGKDVARPALVSLPHPLRPDGKEVCFASFLPGETLGAYIKRNGIRIASGPVHVWHNGHPVPEALWERLIPRPGDMVVIRARMAGGGSGSKILRTVAIIALALTAPYLAGYAMTGTWAAATGLAGGALTAGIMIGGSLLINALLPPPKPTFRQENNRLENSPTYSIQGGRNRARPWEPMLLVFGEHKVVPDLASQPYTEYVGNDQYLAQAFHFGLQPDLDITNIKIGDSPITRFKGVDIERSDADGSLTMIAGNVDTLQGFELRQPDGWNYRTTPTDTRRIDVDLAAQVFAIDQKTGKYLSRTVEVQVEYRAVGASTWTPLGNITDPVYATHYWSLGRMESPDLDWGAPAQWVQLRYGSTNPADHTQGDTVQICTQEGPGGDGGSWTSCRTYEWRWMPHPHASGKPWSGIAPDPLIGYTTTSGVRISGKSPNVVRRLVRVSVPAGQYEIRVRKVTADIDTQLEKNSVAVSQIRCVQVDRGDYTGQLRMAVRIRASAQLNGQIDQLNAICKARCRVWNGSSWVVQHTRNPAWWFLWFAQGKRDANGDLLYGAGLTNSQVDLDGIKAWAAWCDSKGLTFDYVLDRRISAAQMLQIIARAGRASPTWQSGKLGVIWDAPNLPVVAIFGPMNIRAGSFRVDYINEGTVDEIVLNFTDRTANYTMGEVRVRVPGATTTQNPLQLDLEGVTSPVLAGREANLLAASQVWHRRRVSWETDIEGYIANRGDVVQISHDLTVWGYSGRMIGRSGNTIKLDAKIPSDGSGIAMLRDPEGTLKTVNVVSAVGDVDELTIVSDLDGFPLPGDPGFEDVPAVDWVWMFDPLATPGRRFKIVEVRPTEDGVRFSAIDDDPGYYASENNPYQYTPPRDGALLSGVVMSLSVSEQIVSVAADQIRLRIEWAISAAVPVAVDLVVNGDAKPTIITSERYADVLVQTGDVVEVTVTPRPAAGIGIGKDTTYTVQGLAMPLPPVEGLTSVFRDGLTVLRWNRVVDIRNPDYEVRMGPTWANSSVVGITSELEMLAIGNGLYHVAARFVLPNGTVIYGPPDSLQIDGATLVRNVILVRDEAPDWDGDVAEDGVIYNGTFTLAPQGDVLEVENILSEQDVLWLGGAAERGLYTIAESSRVDIGYVAPVRVDFDIVTQVYNLTDDILLSPDVFEIEDVLDGSRLQHVRATPQIRHAQVLGDWTEWRDFVPGLINARYIDVRLILETDDPLYVPAVENFVWSIDVPDLVQHGEGVTVPVNGARVTFTKTFHAVPNVQITILDAIDGDQAVLTNVDESGFDIEVINASSSVEREINWLAQGY